MLNLTLVTAPAYEPVHLDEAKNHLRVDSDVTADDAAIQALIVASRQHVEAYTRRALISQVYDLKLDGWPESGVLYLPRPPLVGVTSITYLDTNGDSQTWASSNYRVSAPSGPFAQAARITLEYGKSFPDLRPVTENVTIRFEAGYGDDWNAVPQPIRQAMLLLIGEMHERREEAISGTIIANIPFGVDALLTPYKVWAF